MYKYILIAFVFITLQAFSSERCEFSLNDFINHHSSTKVTVKPRAMVKIFEDSKQSFLEEAKFARISANKYFIEAEKYSNFSFSLDIQEQIKALTSSSIGTFLIQNPKEKILVVALSVIGDCAAQYVSGAYENYSNFKRNIGLAAAELERCNAALSMSMGASLFIHHNLTYEDYYLEISENVESSINYLIIVEMYAALMEKPLDSYALSAKIQVIRESMVKEIQNFGRIVTKHSHKINSLMENLPEILAECNPIDRGLTTEIYYTLKTVLKKITIAERRLEIG